MADSDPVPTVAEIYASKWTEHCKDIKSFAFAEPGNGFILLRSRPRGEVLNVRAVTVLEDGFEIEGIRYPGFEMPEIIRDDIEDHMHYAAARDAQERRRRERS